MPMKESAYQRHAQTAPASPTSFLTLLHAGLLLGFLSFCNPLHALALSLTPSSLSFSGTQGGSNPPAQTITFWKGGDRPKDWTVSSASQWLAVSPSSGSMSTERDQITVSVNLSGLSAGSYSTSIVIAIVGAKGRANQSTVPVTLTVTSSTSSATTSSPVISLSVPSLAFTGTAGGSDPAIQSFTVSNTGTGTLSWTAGDNATWLVLSPGSGTNTGTVSASTNLSGLAAGTYSGTITVSATGATSKTLPVSLTVNPGTTAGSASLTWTANTESDLAGYKIYVGTQSGVYGTPISIGNVTTYQLTNLASNTTYFISITAFDNTGNESLHSAEVSKSIY